MPFVRKDDKKQEPIPCGKCPECLKRRASGWAFRLMEEDKVSTSSAFITLTYDTLNVPISFAGYMTLVKRDLQLFMKRLRKAHEPLGGKPLKYYAVGEYGGQTMRPHYHIIMFNCDITLVQPAWENGHVHYGDVEGASVAYTLKYISKKGKIPMHRNDDRLPEFSLMSKGLGKSYLTPAMCAWHKRDLENRMYCNLKDGRKIGMPRYYREKLYSEEEKAAVKFHLERQMAERAMKEIQKNGVNHARIKKARVEAAYRRAAINSIKDDKL